MTHLNDTPQWHTHRRHGPPSLCYLQPAILFCHTHICDARTFAPCPPCSQRRIDTASGRQMQFAIIVQIVNGTPRSWITDTAYLQKNNATRPHANVFLYSIQPRIPVRTR
jgi:hypothetical protein